MIANHRHYEECSSTNDVAREWARDMSDPAPDGAVVTAAYQTAGRGRRGRSWQSEPGDNVLMSIVLRPPYALSDTWRLAFVSAVGVATALDTFGVTVMLKWPNDILVDGRKCGGVLVEVTPPADTRVTGSPDPPTAWAAIVGIGINVNQLQFREDASYELSPTSLRIATAREWRTDEIAPAVAAGVLDAELVHRSQGFGQTASAWRTKMAVGLEIRRGGARGIQTDLQDDGRIRVRIADGTFVLWGTVDGEEPFQ